MREKIVGVILVSPSYHGYAGELEPLIDLCHKKNLPVLVDEAHGSYFLFCENPFHLNPLYYQTLI